MSNIIDKIQVSGVTYDLPSGGGNATVELTQAEYDALVSAGTVSSNTYYIITDAQAGDLTKYWTSAQTQSAITQATSGKVDSNSVVSSVTSASTDSEIPTAKAVYDAIPTGGTGGGKAISAGTNISVTTGETADTVSCTLPIYLKGSTNLMYTSNNNTLKNSANSYSNSIFGELNTIDKYGTNFNYKCVYNTIFGSNNKLFVDINNRELHNSFICGNNNTISSSTNSILASFALGSYNKGNNSRQALIGWNNNATNIVEMSFGQYNVSSSGSSTFGNSGNTLFSVGNGTADNARHNAFEIRQNGDIYLSSGGTDIKLQDHLGGGGGASYSAGTGIDITNNVISVSGVVETSAITTSITSSSTDAQVPSAKAVYDTLGDINTILQSI